MKKFLSLAVVVAALSAVVGCDDKKTTAGPVVRSGSATGSATTMGTAK